MAKLLHFASGSGQGHVFLHLSGQCYESTQLWKWVIWTLQKMNEGRQSGLSLTALSFIVWWQFKENVRTNTESPIWPSEHETVFHPSAWTQLWATADDLESPATQICFLYSVSFARFCFMTTGNLSLWNTDQIKIRYYKLKTCLHLQGRKSSRWRPT